MRFHFRSLISATYSDLHVELNHLMEELALHILKIADDFHICWAPEDYDGCKILECVLTVRD